MDPDPDSDPQHYILGLFLCGQVFLTTYPRTVVLGAEVGSGNGQREEALLLLLVQCSDTCAQLCHVIHDRLWRVGDGNNH